MSNQQLQQKSRLIVNTVRELQDYSALGYPTWLELGNSMGGKVNDLVNLLNENDAVSDKPCRYGLVYDTLHASELEPALTDTQLRALAPFIRLIHWQPARTFVSGKAEISSFLQGASTKSVDQLLAVRGLPGCGELPIVLEPSLHHWRQLGGLSAWFSLSWIEERLTDCLDAMAEQLC